MSPALWEVLSKNQIDKFTEDEREYLDILIAEKLPKHIAIIMDGNGRWAQKYKLPRTVGHRYGAETLKKVIETCGIIGIHTLTIYAFSTENWKRPKIEVTLLMELLVEYIQKEMNSLRDNNIRIISSGNIEELPVEAKKVVVEAEHNTKSNTGLTLNVALNYGGRQEIVRAVQKIAEQVNSRDYAVEDIDEELVEKHLYTYGLPELDLVIRTSDEKRLSNFLLWQCAYAEFFFTETLWPDFSNKELLSALLSYQSRKRRYGGI